MTTMTATAAEARSNFSKIANSVCELGCTVTVFKNSKPWVEISPVGTNSEVTNIDWNKFVVAKPNEDGITVLPAEWDDPEDDGLYDDMV